MRNFKSLSIIALLATAVMGTTANAADWSSFKAIDSIQTVSSSGTTFIRNDSGWGTPGCGGAVFLRIQSSDNAYKEMLAEALTAKAAGFTISGFGDCLNSSTVVVVQLKIK